MELNSELDRALQDLERLGKYEQVERELEKAEREHPNWPNNINEQALIMLEEAGEVAKAVLHFQHEKGTIEQVREELIQTAAMCMRMLENLPSKKVEVFSRPECVFNYCPTPELCKNKCAAGY